LRLGDLAVGPRPDLLGRSQRDLDRVEVLQRGRPICKGKRFHLFAPFNVYEQIHRLISSTSRHSDCSSRTRTLNDSGRPGSAGTSPLTMASYACERPSTSSDLTVRSSCSVYEAPYASSAQTSISPNRWPPNWALPPSGCCVISEYGPIERAWILSSTRCDSFMR